MIDLFKRFLPRGLLGRSLLIVVIPLIVVQIVSAYVFYATHWDTITRRLALSLAGDIVAIVDLTTYHADSPDRFEVLEMATRAMDLRVLHIEGAILPNAPSRRGGYLASSLSEALRAKVQRPFIVDTEHSERDVEIKIQLPEGVLQVFASRKRLFSSTTYVFVAWMVGTSMLLLGVAALFMRNQVRAVQRLASAADNFGKGRDVPDFKLEGATEVRQAASAFNRMRERLSRQIAQRTEMLAGVSHDLRTPLTRMKLQLAMIEGGEEIAGLNQDIAEMERMIEGYLAFARGEGAEPIAPTDIATLLEDLARRFRREGHSVELGFDRAAQFVLPCRPHALERALMNIIANACRHGKRIVIYGGRRADGVEIVIDDDGPGIPIDKREDVFKAFTRLETSRNPKTGGVGLGLTIARDILRGHGGDIRLADAPLGGLRARIHIPS